MANRLARLMPAHVRRRMRGAFHHAVVEAITDPIAGLASELAAVREENRRLIEGLQWLHDAALPKLAEIRSLTGAEFDHIPELRRQLLTARDHPEYKATFEDRNPLVTVRIPTYNRGELLFDRAIPSVLGQTHSNLELIIVGDGCDDDTAERVAAIHDPRVRFVPMLFRGVYPTDPVQRWMVAGSPAMNHGAQLARGRWIAPADDDDEFTADHLEVLIEAALSGGFEMIYGRCRNHGADGPSVIGVYPPRLGQFTFQAGMYMSHLGFFEYEPRSWMLNEPADWNLCRRMLEAGVRIGHIDAFVTDLYPTGPRSESLQKP